MRKEKVITVEPSKMEFYFGNCATIAICTAFNIKYNLIKIFCKLLKIDYNGGMNFWECKKLISTLSDNCSQYIPNDAAVNYGQLAILYNKGKYIVMFDKHLSYMEDGKIYDSYINGENKEFIFRTPTGWWKV